MTSLQEKAPAATASHFLTDQDKATCKQVTAGTAPHSKRAQALLALNKGASPADAAELSGLSEGQVKYWLNRFTKLGIGIFPDVLQPEAAEEVAKTEVIYTGEGSSEDTRPAKKDKKKGKKTKRKTKRKIKRKIKRKERRKSRLRNLRLIQGFPVLSSNKGPPLLINCIAIQGLKAAVFLFLVTK